MAETFKLGLMMLPGTDQMTPPLSGGRGPDGDLTGSSPALEAADFRE